MKVGMNWNGVEVMVSDFSRDMRGYVAYSIAGMCNTYCSNRKAALKLLYHEADRLIEAIQSGKVPE